MPLCASVYSSADPEGGTGGPDPPGKSQVIWVSIGNKQLDPSWKKLDPPAKRWTPSGTLNNDRFLISLLQNKLRTKKKKKKKRCQSFFCQTDLDPP